MLKMAVKFLNEMINRENKFNDETCYPGYREFHFYAEIASA